MNKYFCANKKNTLYQGERERERRRESERKREREKEGEREGETGILHCIYGGHLLYYNCNILRIISLVFDHGGE